MVKPFFFSLRGLSLKVENLVFSTLIETYFIKFTKEWAVVVLYLKKGYRFIISIYNRVDINIEVSSRIPVPVHLGVVYKQLTSKFSILPVILRSDKIILRWFYNFVKDFIISININGIIPLLF